MMILMEVGVERATFMMMMIIIMGAGSIGNMEIIYENISLCSNLGKLTLMTYMEMKESSSIFIPTSLTCYPHLSNSKACYARCVECTIHFYISTGFRSTRLLIESFAWCVNFGLGFYSLLPCYTRNLSSFLCAWLCVHTNMSL